MANKPPRDTQARAHAHTPPHTLHIHVHTHTHLRLGSDACNVYENRVTTYENRRDGHENKSSPEVPFFPDENCILMCVHKDERKSRPSCLFVFSSWPPFRCAAGATGADFVQEYFWMAAIDVYGSLRRFAPTVEIPHCRPIVYLFPFLLSQLQGDSVSLPASWLRSPTHD